jgi:exosortase
MPVEVSIHSDGSRVDVRRPVAARNTLFALLMAVSAVAFWSPLRNLVTLCMGSEEYSYILLIPVMVLGLFYLEQGTVFKHLDYSLAAGALVILAGLSIAGCGAVLSTQFSAESRPSLEILGLVTICIGAFVLCYGTGASRAGLFALLFSLLLVPLPEIVMAKPIAFIQHASAHVTGFLFTLTGVPAFREGLTFSLPRLTFVVATECSGIHSSIALFIASILVGHFYFRPGWKRPLLVLLVFPIISFTNGLRMYVLATLAVYVDMSFFHGNLHHKGGSLFFALALVILAVATKLLRGRWRVRSAALPAKAEAVRV